MLIGKFFEEFFLYYRYFLFHLAIQDLLTNPNPKSPANGLANALYLKDKEGYKRRVRKEAAKFAGIA